MSDTTDLLTRAKHEITQLRRHNEVLSAQVSVVEVFAAALGLRSPQGGMSPDVVWEIERHLDAEKVQVQS